MARFELVSRFAGCDELLPSRGTSGSAGYDLYVAEDSVIPSVWALAEIAKTQVRTDELRFYTLDEVAVRNKRTGFKPTLVSTGVKCKLDEGTYLKVVVRSSTPLKYGLVMANSEGIVDSDYFANPQNEGEIFVQLYNFSPYDIILKKGDRIAQGIISSYEITEDDTANGKRDGGFGSTNV